MSTQIDCPCPPKSDGSVRHPNGDQITFREALDFQTGMTVRNKILIARENDPETDVAEILTMLTTTYLLDGVESWTLTDGKEPIPVTKGNIRRYLLSDVRTAITLGDAADELYREAVMLPLLRPASNSSPDTPTASSTSPTNGESPTPESKPRKRSSTITTQTDGTEPTTALHAGGYSSSRN